MTEYRMQSRGKCTRAGDISYPNVDDIEGQETIEVNKRSKQKTSLLMASLQGAPSFPLSWTVAGTWNSKCYFLGSIGEYLFLANSLCTWPLANPFTWLLRGQESRIHWNIVDLKAGLMCWVIQPSSFSPYLLWITMFCFLISN